MGPVFLSRPIRIGSKTAPNRIVYQPLECNDADERGNPTELTLERYRKFAEGAPGIIFVEACHVTRESRGRIRGLGVEPRNLEGVRALVQTIRSVNPEVLILFQISDDGRRSGRFSRVVSVYPADDPHIHLLTTAELVAIEDMFADAAWVVEQAGGDGIDWAEKNLREGATDMVGIGRQALADPHCARKILKGQGAEIQYCAACQGCFKLVANQEQAGCTSFDTRYKEVFRQLQRRLKARAGESAWVAATGPGVGSGPGTRPTAKG